MSLSSAMANAVSGLNASSRGAEVVASNLANASNAAYARQELTLGTNAVGGGVAVIGVARVRDAALQGALNLAAGATAQATTRSDAASSLADLYGTPSETGSLTATYDQFESALITAQAAPEDSVRLQAVIDSAADVANQVNQISDSIQEQRLTADRAIATDVEAANDLLQQIETLNHQITALGAQNTDANALLDLRDSAVSELSEIVPVRSLSRSDTTIALMTNDGRMLLDGHAATIEFTPVRAMTSDMTVETGPLSTLTINGKASDDPLSGLSGGRLAANLWVRDTLLPDAQNQLDTLSEGLGAATALGSSGSLFEFDGTELSVAAAVNPAQGGALWRLRDGLDAASAGPVADAGYIVDTIDTLQNGIGAFGDAAFSDLFADLVSTQSANALREEAQATQFVAGQSALSEARAVEGVDSDSELQDLLLVEQSYAANARVISAVDEMMETLLGII